MAKHLTLIQARLKELPKWQPAVPGPDGALPDLTSEERAALRAYAEAASDGDWFATQMTRDGSTVTVYAPNEDLEVIAQVRVDPMLFHTKQDSAANASHIAAANPRTILRMLAMIERYEAEVAAPATAAAA